MKAAFCAQLLLVLAVSWTVSGQASVCPVDVVFVMDESGSVGSSNYEKMKTFAAELVAMMDVDSGKTRVGIVEFSSNIGDVINLNAHSSVAALQTAIGGLSHSGGGTATDKALDYVRTSMLTASAGDRDTEANVVVVFTDGQSNDRAKTLAAADNLKNFLSTHGVASKIVSVGLGSGVDVTEMEGMATAPSTDNYIYVQSFNDLALVQTQIEVRDASCAAPVPTCDYSNPQSRTDCGYGGITSAECIAKGCCWDTSVMNVKWCFDPTTP